MRSGFTADDLLDGGSDRLCDAMVAWGDEETIARRVREHHDAGADHVCIQVVTAPDAGPTRVRACRSTPGAPSPPRSRAELPPPSQGVASRSQVVAVTPRARSSCLRTRIDASVRGRSSTTST